MNYDWNNTDFHPDYQPEEFTQEATQVELKRTLARLLFIPIGVIAVLVIVAALAA